ncbi:MAG: hypothetical protein ABI480_14730 [Chitinophagaceae bacterium]
MKGIIMTLAFIASSMFAFAGEGNVSKNVLTAFGKEFQGATEVSWSAGSDYYRAEFVLNNQYISAFFSNSGELMGVTRNISSLNLPLTLQNKLRKEYGNYWISDLFEVSNREGTRYYVTLENADKKMTLKSDSDTNWDVFSKSAKL